MSASKMTIITGLEFTEVDTPEYGFVRARSFNLGCSNRYPRIPLLKDAEPPKEVAYMDYYIRGRRVRTPNGKEVYLGNAPEVEEFLGLQFDLFENLKKENEDALFKLSKAEIEKSDALFRLSKAEEEKINALFKLSKAEEEKSNALFKLSESQQAVEQLRGMSFLRRLKFLFTGELV